MKPVAAAIDRLAAAAGGDVLGDGSLLIDGAAEAAHAGHGKVTYASSEKYLEDALAAGASCIVVPKHLMEGPRSDTAQTSKAQEAGVSFIVVDDARLAFARILGVLYPRRVPDPGVHPTAVIHAEARLGTALSIGPYTVVERGASLGDGCVLASGCHVGSDVEIGSSCSLGPNVVLYEGVRLGSRVNVEAGTVIGSQGFGWAPADGRYAGVPQVGTVVIEDDVDIGANVTIDRATLGETRVGQGTKIDNLVHIAHNVRIGKHCAISGQVGIAGSSTVGDWVVLAGQVGVADHVVIGDNVKVGAKSGISSGKIVRGNQIIWGIPARELKEAKRQAATLARLSKSRERNQS
jgi:UDP-3-O-[3-hydroxymyristoyl] glucosamine N-acyltransferase